MANILSLVTRLGDKSGSLGAVVAAMGCSFCFPAIASLGAAIGLGFLAQWEGFLLTRILPGAAILTLLVNVLGYLYHRQWYRSVLGAIGPITILLVLNFWFATYWRTDAIYGALGLMVAVSIWDIFWPSNRHCDAAQNIEPEIK
ncbi:MAG: organomercurial transporter MerC [Gammaproteobacteria bacterium]|nr:organomercurial transporter MerC [Gammaproteobacteria bacterium]MDH3857046.1 organomercurial transporter MerC [Gammaproteobacteria bacterium]